MSRHELKRRLKAGLGISKSYDDTPTEHPASDLPSPTGSSSSKSSWRPHLHKYKARTWSVTTDIAANPTTAPKRRSWVRDKKAEKRNSILEIEDDMFGDWHLRGDDIENYYGDRATVERYLRLEREIAKQIIEEKMTGKRMEVEGLRERGRDSGELNDGRGEHPWEMERYSEGWNDETEYSQWEMGRRNEEWSGGGGEHQWELDKDIEEWNDGREYSQRKKGMHNEELNYEIGEHQWEIGRNDESWNYEREESQWETERHIEEWNDGRVEHDWGRQSDST